MKYCDEIKIFEDYEIKNEKLKKMVEEKANKMDLPVKQLIWNYINRGLMEDTVTERMFKKCHDEEYIKEYNEALGFKDY